MQTTNSNNSSENPNFKDPFSSSASKKVSLPPLRPNRQRCFDAHPQSIETLLEAVSPKSSVENKFSKDILQHLSLLRNLSNQILPFFPPALQKHLQIGHLRQEMLIIYADSAQSARLARASKDHVQNVLSSFQNTLPVITQIKICVNPALKMSDIS